MQYTIRNIPEYLDAALRTSARQEGKSLNEVAVQALVRGAGLGNLPSRKRDLSDLAGTWREDPEFDRALATQHAIDEELWPQKKNVRKQARKRSAA
jgi:plasmid stability protein